MSATTPLQTGKITYTSASTDMNQFHRLFDEALIRARAKSGGFYPLYISGRAIKPAEKPFDVRSPADSELVLGRFAPANQAHADSALKAAKKAQRDWGARPWQERVRIIKKAAAIIRARKFDIAAMMSLEVGKNRLEAMGDAEESADLADYYSDQMRDAHGFLKQMDRLLPNENAISTLRPYGVFVCIAPFNFPMALSTGMSTAALLAGNAVVYKPAEQTPGTGLLLYECLRDAELPPGIFHYLPGDWRTGEALWKHPLADGVVFTGSKEVGLRIAREFSKNYIKPALMEMGGKNAAVITKSADIDMAAEGVVKSAFGLQGQKCSACSRVYVDSAVADAFIEKLIAKTAAIKKGDPAKKDVYFGPVISKESVKRFVKTAALAKKTGKILIGGGTMAGKDFAKGFFVDPTIAELPLGSELFRRELFLPFLAVGRVKSLNQAIAEANKAEYGLTAGIFTQKKEEIERFFNEVEAGVCYANRKSGATTGAWPGVQPFCGWKGSGSTGKGGCGPYYVTQFMREQSRTIME
ncbi:MAG: aldehyde dehydrogenase family protein [Elusimicrobiota bacterium]